MQEQDITEVMRGVRRQESRLRVGHTHWEGIASPAVGDTTSRINRIPLPDLVHGGFEQVDETRR